jgi:hypothetical protein
MCRLSALDNVFNPRHCLGRSAANVGHMSRTDLELSLAYSIAGVAPGFDSALRNAFYIGAVEWISKESKSLRGVSFREPRTMLL